MRRQNGTGQNGGNGRSGGWRGRLGPALGLAGVAILAACAAQTVILQSTPAPNGGVRITLTQPGPSRILVRRDKGAPPWKSVAVRNTGAAVVRGIRLWGLGKRSLLAAPEKNAEGQPIYTPFSLLPGEQFVCSVTGGDAGQDAMLSGIFYWELPKEEKLAAASLAGRRGGEMGAAGIALNPGNGESWVEFRFSAPLPHTSARLAWTVTAAQASPQVWINLDGNAWARLLVPNAPRVDWEHPLDLTSKVAGYRNFWIRLAYKHERRPEYGREAEQPLPEELEIRRLRMEREVQGPGALRAWRNGRNELSTGYTSPKDARLELELLNTQ